MRKLLITCILCIYCSIYAIAQSSSFYCGNNKYMLIEKANRFVTISPKAECLNTKSAQAIDSVSDKNTTIRVYETNSKNPSARSASNYAEQIHDDNIIILPCYENQNGEELIPTDIVYLKLKNSNDINILSNMQKITCAIIVHNAPRRVGCSKFVSKSDSLFACLSE